MTDEELKLVIGGSNIFSASFLNAIVRGINLLLELGRTIGSSIRRGVNNSMCSF